MDLGIGRLFRPTEEYEEKGINLFSNWKLKPTRMITTLMFLLGILSFWLLFRLVDAFEKM